MDDAYDRYPYDSLAYDVTHPARTEALARLHGLDPAPTDACRVLEIGCGQGGNLLAMAALLPGSRFVGVDRSAVQIAAARRDTAAIGATNVRFEAVDLREVPDAWGPFDRVICHGVYSWVPADVARALLELTARVLAPQGVAYLSFNTLPGWHARGLLRDLLRRRVPPGEPAAMVRAARAELDLLREHAAAGELTAWLNRELDLLAQLSGSYLYFEHLVDDNHPAYLTDVVAAAEAAGLAYLADADVNRHLTSVLALGGTPPPGGWAAQRLADEQRRDELGLRCFRRSLLCRAADPPSAPDDPARLSGAWITSDLVPDPADPADAPPDAEHRFVGANDRVVSSTNPVATAALGVLAGARPGACHLDTLTAAVTDHLRDRAEVAVPEPAAVHAVVLDLVLRGELVAGWSPPPVTAVLPERPTASRLVRWQALQGEPLVTTPAHGVQRVDQLDRVLLAAMDGRTDRAGLEAAVATAEQQGRLMLTIDDAPLSDGAIREELLDTKLAGLLDAGLVLDLTTAALHTGAPPVGTVPAQAATGGGPPLT